MEIITGVIGTLWEQLKDVTLPIINMSIVDFLLGVFVLTIIVDVLRALLGMQLNKTTFTEYDTGVKRDYVNNSKHHTYYGPNPKNY